MPVATPHDPDDSGAARAQAYGGAPASLSVEQLTGVVVEGQVLTVERVADLAAEGVEPQRTWVAEGYLEELRARLAWSSSHQHLFRAG